MKEEIAATVFFIARLAKKHGKLGRVSREKFAVALTSALFENYKSHWYADNPSKGQAFRCIRMNKAQMRDPIFERACRLSEINYDDLGLPKELTIWVDPGEVSCRSTIAVAVFTLVGAAHWWWLRYGEKTTPFCVTLLEGQKGDGEFSRRINNAVERASSDYHSGTSSDEEGGNTSISSSFSSNVSSTVSSTNSSSFSALPEPKCIPTVSNPNSVYQFSEFPPALPMQTSWAPYPKRKPYQGDGYQWDGQQHAQVSGQYPQHKSFKNYRPSFAFSGPRVDKYHWVSKNRS